jgi:transposase
MGWTAPAPRHRCATTWSSVNATTERSRPPCNITNGLDLAKHWFQVHGVDAAGKIVVRRRLRCLEVVDFFRDQEPCLVGMEACATAHHWARELIALGHEVKLMPPAYVKGWYQSNSSGRL